MCISISAMHLLSVLSITNEHINTSHSVLSITNQYISTLHSVLSITNEYISTLHPVLSITNEYISVLYITYAYPTFWILCTLWIAAHDCPCCTLLSCSYVRRYQCYSLLMNRERVLYWQPTGPNPPHHLESSLLTSYWSESTTSSWCVGRPALRHGSLNSLFHVAWYLRSCNWWIYIWHKGAGAEVDGALSQDSCHSSLLSGLYVLSGLLHITVIDIHYYFSSMCITIIYLYTLL